ncbi:MAG: 2OG-Fe dioxygenase family protein [Acidobacteriota bacterium]
MASLETLHLSESLAKDELSADSAENDRSRAATVLSARTVRRPAGLTSDLAEALRHDAFVHVSAESLAYLRAQNPTEAHELQQSWNCLGPDEYLDGPSFRKRRYAMYRGEIATGNLVCKPHGPHFQKIVHNPVFGGHERWFLPIERQIARNRVLCELIGIAQDVFAQAGPTPSAFHIEVHQFRIEPLDEGAGHPTPEGLHRDGRNWVAIFMIARENIRGGETRICDLTTEDELAQLTLESPFEAVFLNDHAVKHSTTDIRPAVATRDIAYRDVLVVTFIDEDQTAGEVSHPECRSRDAQPAERPSIALGESGGLGKDHDFGTG